MTCTGSPSTVWMVVRSDSCRRTISLIARSSSVKSMVMENRLA